MQKTGLLLAIVLLILVFGGCGQSADDILEKYESYAEAEGADNKAGIAIGDVDQIGDMFMINVAPSHPAVNQSEENAGVLANRLRVLDAADPSKEIEFQLALVNATTTRADGTSTQSNFPAIRLPKNTKSKFIIVYFEGISQDEAPEVATQPIFFLLEKGKKEMKVLTKTPLLAGDLIR